MATALIFDSGVGGLSIFQAVTQRLPQLSVVYASDNAAFPYGTKTAGWLEQRVIDCIKAISEQCTLDIIIIACNTASTIVLPSLRSRFDIPVVGVVPAIKTAAQQTKTGCIGLLATPGTVRRRYTDQLIQDFASHCKVIKVGTSDLVELAEQKLRGEQICTRTLTEVIQPLISEPSPLMQQPNLKPDQVVLGCTHFPLLIEELEQLMPNIEWVDSGSAIANRVASLLPVINNTTVPTANTALATSIAIRDSYCALFTKPCHHVDQLIPALNHLGIEQINYLPEIP